MIAGIVAFLAVVSVIASVAAWGTDNGVRRLSVPARWVWLCAMAASPVLLIAPAVAFGRMTGSLGRVGAVSQVFELAPILVGPGVTGIEWARLDPVLGGVWLLLSLGLVGLLFLTHRGLLKERAGWQVTQLFGRELYVSSDRGPAMAGLFRPWIVLPRWALALPRNQLSLVVLHEEEHMRGRDAYLLAAALAFVVLTPWNPMTWWQLRRLRMAMELDCDRRVLRRKPDLELYGTSLIAVAARASHGSLGLAAFSERRPSLQRRIVAMTETRSRWTPVQSVLMIALALVVGAQACGIQSPVATGSESVGSPAEPEIPPSPAGIDEPETVIVPQPPTPVAGSDTRGAAPARPPEVDLRAEPTFTPFTVAPSITNRDEVVAAMNGSYPPLLREAGIGGTVRVYFFINKEGRVEDYRIDQSSGHPALDDAALAVAGVYRFTPARNRADPTPVWVSFPITFQVR